MWRTGSQTSKRRQRPLRRAGALLVALLAALLVAESGSGSAQEGSSEEGSESESAVIHLTEETFDAFIESNDFSMIELCASTSPAAARRSPR